MPTTVPAFSAFSTVSQSDANNQAIAMFCASSCCVEFLALIPALFAVNLTYDSQDDLVFTMSQISGIHAINPATDTVVGTQYDGANTYNGGIVYVPTVNRVYACVNAGGTVVYQIVNPLTMAVVGTVSAPAGHTFLEQLQGFYDSTANRLIVAGRLTAGFLPSILQIDIASGVSSALYTAASTFDTIEWPGGHDTSRNRFLFKLVVGGNSSLTLFNAGFGIIGSTPLGASGGSGNTGDVLYVPEADKFFFSGVSGPGDQFLQVNASTIAIEATISATRGSIWWNPACSIVFQRTLGSVVQWDYLNESLLCNPAVSGFGFGATTSTGTGKSYVNEGTNGIQSLEAP